MDFNLSEEQTMFKETARRFAQSQVAPRIAEMEEKRKHPVIS